MGLDVQGRRRSRQRWRPHPLVREFLLGHLEAELGESRRRRDASATGDGAGVSRSWRLAARHWAAAGDAAEVRRVICAATPAIIGTGDLAAADEFLTRFPDPDPNPWFDIIETQAARGGGTLRRGASPWPRRSGERAAELALVDRSYSLARALNRAARRLESERPVDPRDRVHRASTRQRRRPGAGLDRESGGLDAMLASDYGSLDLLCEALIDHGAPEPREGSPDATRASAS